MPDELDRNQERQEQERQALLAAHHARMQKSATASATHCEECGDEIPEPRRAAVPGCRHCVDCQSWLEKGAGFWP
jgi:phage/conjugal plasmid C-4 type zinc finger TraR family protein